MAFSDENITLATGDMIKVSVDDKTYTGKIKEVIRTSGSSYRLTIESSEQEFPIKGITVDRKLTDYMSF